MVSAQLLTWCRMKQQHVKHTTTITSLPLDNEDRAEFIETANKAFETVLRRMEPQDPDAIRKVWDAAYYVDHHLIGDGMLPIDRDYALSLIDAFLVHYVLELIDQVNTTKH